VHEGTEAELCKRPSKNSFPCWSNMKCANKCITEGNSGGYCKGMTPLLQSCMCTYQCDDGCGGGGGGSGGGGGGDGGGSGMVQPRLVPPHTRRAGSFE
jgi:hypothetical protein